MTIHKEKEQNQKMSFQRILKIRAKNMKETEGYEVLEAKGSRHFRKDT